jgi:cell division protein FtsI/penicillin-binding protein 2
MTRTAWRPLAVAAACAGLLSACGGSSSTPQSTLHSFLTDWERRDFPAMKKLVADPPAGFATVNADALTALGVTKPRFGAGRVTSSGSRASARVTEELPLPGVATWTSATTVRMLKRGDQWLVDWSPATINPALRTGDRLAAVRQWPARAQILGAGGAPLTVARPIVSVGIVGSRIKDRAAVSRDLEAAGATRAEVTQALAQAKAHPTFFDPVFVVSKSRYEQLKRRPGPGNVYAVPGTSFELVFSRSAITDQLAAHVVGNVAPITADQLHALGSPYDASSSVGQTGLEQAFERRLAGSPRTRIELLDSGGGLVRTLAGFGGHPGAPVSSSIDPAVQRAAESALDGVHHAAAMVAMRASTGQILAVVSDPVSYAYDQALEGRYPPGSTFKVLTATALLQGGLSPSSPASCPPSLTIDGQVFHNAEGDRPVQTLDQAFAESCNTAFIGLATAHLNASEITSAAGLYGLNGTAQPGLAAFMASVPAPTSRNELAATAIGQAGVIFSPLGMATVAAAIDSGSARLARLVTGAPDDRRPSRPVPTAVLTGLRQMMADVVSAGTAAGTGLPSATHAKTGTAQYGTGNTLRTDAWLMGYDGDIAFAVVVQDSGGVNGGPLDGPVIAKFLTALGSSA